MAGKTEKKAKKKVVEKEEVKKVKKFGDQEVKPKYVDDKVK